VEQKFAENSSDTHVAYPNAVLRLITKFRETGSSVDVLRSGRQPVLAEEKRLDISDRIS
jgi:hypothetical protein